jgi:hypothetical protein
VALALIGLLIVPMTLANMTQFLLAARAMHVIRATQARELTLIERLRDVPGLALNLSPDVPLLGNVSARRYFTAIDQFGAPHIDGVSDDLPGPDGTALNAVAVQLLGDAISAGPAGAPGPTAQVLSVIRGYATDDVAPGCTLLQTSSGTAQATWSPPTAGVAIRMTGAAQLQLAAGLFEPADAPVADGLRDAIRGGDTFWLPALPRPFSWTLALSVTGEARLQVCSLE